VTLIFRLIGDKLVVMSLGFFQKLKEDVAVGSQA